MTLLSAASHVLLEAAPIVAANRWAVRVNQLCLQGLAPWLADEFGVTAGQVAAAVRSHQSLWPLVTGSAVPLSDGTRLILIPSAAIDHSELRVPQEWVDIPAWAGDYYAAVRVEPDSGQLCVWGYATHAQIKQANYQEGDRSYSLDGEALTDLAVLPVARALGLTTATRAPIPSLPDLPTEQVDALVQRLRDVQVPRLAVPFELWGALIQDEGLRSRLATVGTTNLSQWLTQAGLQLTQGWQTLESLLSPRQTTMAFRSSETAVRNGKRLRLGSDTVILLVVVETEADDRISIRVQLRPDVESDLPETLELSLLSPTGETVQTVTRLPQDESIQLKRFRLPPGYDFTVQVRVGTATLQESFTA